MRKLGGFTGLVAFMVAALAANEASADVSMNPALSRFVLDQDCHQRIQGGQIVEYGHYNDSVNGRWCQPDNNAFKRLINQWGFVLAPSAMHSARTTGFGGFHFSAEAMYTKIDNDAEYWKLGTQGSRDPTTGEGSIRNGDPPSVIQLYSAKVRKSFGFGLELTTAVGFVPQTTILTGGADVRMSLLEGFRTGVLGIFPDIAVGGGVRTMTGTPEFQLTTAALDAQISKPLTISSVSQLTPWIGYQYLWIFGDSGLIDLTPATDPLGYCGYTGVNVPGTPGATPGDFNGQPVCSGGQPTDFNNNVVFDNARLERQRLLVGLNYRYEVVMFGAEFIYDIVDPADAQSDADDEDVLQNVPRQWSLVFELGAMF